MSESTRPGQQTAVRQSFMNDLIYSVRSNRIKSALLSLLWTAGPVTVIAIVIGYFVGHGGDMPPLATLLYFSVYVAVVGLFGLLSRIISDSWHARKKDQLESNYLEVFDACYAYMIYAFNHGLSHLTVAQRQQRLATYLLSKSHATVDEMHYAFHLIFDETSAQAVKQVELCRQNGVYVHYLLDPQVQMAKNQVNQNTHVSETLRQLACQRLEGQSPDIRKGMVRETGFLSKLLNSGGNIHAFSLEDSRALIVLLIELLAGRKIPYFIPTIRFRRNRQINWTFHRIEHLREQIRLQHFQAYGLIKQLTKVTGKTTAIELPPLDEDFSNLQDNLQTMKQSAQVLSKGMFARQKQKAIRRIVFAFDKLSQQIDYDYRLLSRVQSYWSYLAKRFSTKKFEKALDIRLAYVMLHDQDKVTLTSQLHEHFMEKVHFDDADGLKQLALIVLEKLKKLVNFKQPMIVNAIESSVMANLTSITKDHSARAKLEQTHNLVRSLSTDLVSARQQFMALFKKRYHLDDSIKENIKKPSEQVIHSAER